MKSRSEIWLRALSELGAQCSVDTWRDAETLTSRVTREGDTFFKVALPAFLKDFERSLREERIPQDAFKGYARKRGHVWITDEFGHVTDMSRTYRGAPKFLGGFLDLLFPDKVILTQFDFRRAVKRATEDGMPGPEYQFCSELYQAPMGSMEESRQADAIWAIRQLCGMFGKERELCSDDLIRTAVESYVKTDEELASPF